MNKESVAKLAREAGWTGIYSQWVSPTKREHLTVPVTMEQIERFAFLVAAEERAACAKVLVDMFFPEDSDYHYIPDARGALKEAHVAIRSRGGHE